MLSQINCQQIFSITIFKVYSKKRNSHNMARGNEKGHDCYFFNGNYKNPEGIEPTTSPSVLFLQGEEMKFELKCIGT